MQLFVTGTEKGDGLCHGDSLVFPSQGAAEKHRSLIAAYPCRHGPILRRRARDLGLHARPVLAHLLEIPQPHLPHGKSRSLATLCAFTALLCRCPPFKVVLIFSFMDSLALSYTYGAFHPELTGNDTGMDFAPDGFSYLFPSWANAICWLISGAEMGLIPLFVCVMILKYKVSFEFEVFSKSCCDLESLSNYRILFFLTDAIHQIAAK